MTAGFAERLRKLRADKGISQQLAVKMMVDRSSIARWEDGARSPDITLMPRLSERRGCVQLAERRRRVACHPPGHSGFLTVYHKKLHDQPGLSPKLSQVKREVAALRWPERGNA